MISTKKIFWLWLVVALAITSGCLFTTYATDEIGGTISNGIDQWLTVALPCSPASVSNGTVNATTCAITCSSNYTLSNNACVATVSPTVGPTGWPWPTTDNCTGGDFSPSHYDNLCGTQNSTGTINNDRNWVTSWSIVWSPYTDELNNAYLYAFTNGITTMGTIQQANLEWTLIRAHMAKMMSNYAIKILGKVPNTWALCEFDDIADQSTEMKFYIKLSCQLWLMGQGLTSFNPYGIVTRAQFGTVLSRAMRWDTYNMDGDLYYTNHLQALADHDIITNTDPLLQELRWYVMLMLMRADK